MKYTPFVLAIALAMSSSYVLAQSTGSGISVLPPGASTTTSHQEKGKPVQLARAPAPPRARTPGSRMEQQVVPLHSAEQARPNTADPRQERLTVNKRKPRIFAGLFWKGEIPFGTLPSTGPM
jgi:hypothetical protein